jgi:antitoxin MazE
MRIEIVKWGNSTAVRLPAVVLRELEVAIGDQLDLSIKGRKITLEPVTRREYQLSELLAGITRDNLHGAVDFGAPVGRETW